VGENMTRGTGRRHYTNYGKMKKLGGTQAVGVKVKQSRYRPRVAQRVPGS